MGEQQILTFEEVQSLDPRTTGLWVTPSVAAQAENHLAIPTLKPFEALPEHVHTLVVIGGGTWLDEAKAWWTDRAPHLRLIAIPSIWGSGAEASSIVVLNRGETKSIRMDEKLRPSARAVWTGLAESIPPARARFACGDVWAHALEGFLSPLAGVDLRTELAALIARMLAAPMTNDPVWFEFSAQACAGQARSSVGLVHGIAHTLEGTLRKRLPNEEWGHAQLCSLYLWPVMRFNERASGKWNDLLSEYKLSGSAILETLKTLFDPVAYTHQLPLLKELWMPIVRDMCSRTNSALVRPSSLEFFAGMEFQ